MGRFGSVRVDSPVADIQADVATDAEVLALVDHQHLFGIGIGYVDAQLLAATMLTPGARLWTRDKRLASVATRLGVSRVDEQSA